MLPRVPSIFDEDFPGPGKYQPHNHSSNYTLSYGNADVGMYGACPAGRGAAHSPVAEFLGSKGEMVTAYRDGKVKDGFATIAKIQCDGVIDAFMSANPAIRAILWGSGPLNLSKLRGMLTVAIANEVAIVASVADIPELQGYRPLGADRTASKWMGPGGDVKYVKNDPGWKMPDGVNDVRMRIFANMVGLKLKSFNSGYGWDAYSRGYYIPNLADPNNHAAGDYILVSRKFTDPGSKSARKWTLPQLHYLGMLHIDPGVPYGNMGMTTGPHPAPVDMDALQRGTPGRSSHRWALMRMNNDISNAKWLGEAYLQTR